MVLRLLLDLRLRDFKVDRSRPVKFGMDKFKDILYHEVHTLGVEDLKKYFYPVLFD